MQHVSTEEAKTHLPDLIDAAVDGEEVVITKDGEAGVRLVPVDLPRRRHPQFGSAQGLIKMSDDLDEPLDDFKGYR